MSSSGGFLDFFILEAGEYLEQLDELLSRGGLSGPPPNAEAIQRLARSLRGTATMAKLPSFAALAAAVERVGRALHEGSVHWQPAVSGALIAAVDDLKTLVRSARSWSIEDDRRAAVRIAELAHFGPTLRAPAVPAPAASSVPFLATETSNIAAGLELLTARPADPPTAGNVLRRVRAIRGIAGVKEIPALADVLEATEDAVRPLEVDGKPLSPEAITLLGASASLLRGLGQVLRTGGDAAAPSEERDRFFAAFDEWSERQHEREHVVPISELFFADDAGVVDAAQQPPTSMFDRFRLELVSQGEHLSNVIQSARDADDPADMARAGRELRRALRSLQTTAESYGQRELAEFVASHAASADVVEALDLGALETLATLLAEPAIQASALTEQIRALRASAKLAVAIGSGFDGRSAVPAPAATPSGQAPLTPASPGQLLERLDASIAALNKLVDEPLSPRTPIREEIAVSVESLLYRGHAALDRAMEIRDQLRRDGPTSDPSALDELFDLLELARVE